MATGLECLCCQEVDIIATKADQKSVGCITMHSGFHANCLDEDVLEVGFFDYVKERGYVGDHEPVNE